VWVWGWVVWGWWGGGVPHAAPRQHASSRSHRSIASSTSPDSAGAGSILTDIFVHYSPLRPPPSFRSHDPSPPKDQPMPRVFHFAIHPRTRPGVEFLSCLFVLGFRSGAGPMIHGSSDRVERPARHHRRLSPPPGPFDGQASSLLCTVMWRLLTSFCNPSRPGRDDRSRSSRSRLVCSPMPRTRRGTFGSHAFDPSASSVRPREPRHRRSCPVGARLPWGFAHARSKPLPGVFLPYSQRVAGPASASSSRRLAPTPPSRSAAQPDVWFTRHSGPGCPRHQHTVSGICQGP